jgi:hypothetical protein
MPNSTAHGGTVVDNQESGPTLAAHRGEKLLRREGKNNSTEIRNTEIRIFSNRSVSFASLTLQLSVDWR